MRMRVHVRPVGGHHSRMHMAVTRPLLAEGRDGGEDHVLEGCELGGVNALRLCSGHT